MSARSEWFVHRACHRFSHPIPRRFPYFQNLWPMFLLPYTLIFAEVFLHIGQTLLRRMWFLLDRDVEYGTPEGQVIGTTLVNVIRKRARHEEYHARIADRSAQTVPKESRWI